MKKIYSITRTFLLIGFFSFAPLSSALSEETKPDPVICDEYVIVIGDHSSPEGNPLIDEELLQCYHRRLEEQGKSVISVSLSKLMRNPIEDDPSKQYCYILFSHGLGKSKPYKVKVNADADSYVELADVLRGLPGTPSAINLFTCQAGEAAKCEALSCTALFCASPSWENLSATDLNDWLKAVCDGTIKASGDPAEIFKSWRPERSGLLPFGGYRYPTGEVGGKVDSISDDFFPSEKPALPPVAPPAVVPPVVIIPK